VAAEMKVGDLVRCPESCRQTALQHGELKVRDKVPGYIGVVSHVCGYKITVLGGNVLSWDSIEGKRMWDKADLTLVRQ